MDIAHLGIKTIKRSTTDLAHAKGNRKLLLLETIFHFGNDQRRPIFDIICHKTSHSTSSNNIMSIISSNNCLKTKRELKCQNELFLKYNFSGNISVFVFITEVISQTFDVIVDDPYLTE